jgi:hypothetical protein
MELIGWHIDDEGQLTDAHFHSKVYQVIGKQRRETKLNCQDVLPTFERTDHVPRLLGPIGHEVNDDGKL